MILFEKYRKRKSLVTFAVILFSIVFVQSAVLNPLYIWLSSNAVMARTVLPTLIEGIIQLSSLPFYWISLVYLLFLATRFSAKTTLGGVGIYAASTVLHSALGLLSGHLLLGFPTGADFLDELKYPLFDIAADLAIIAFGALLLFLSLHKALRMASNRSTFFEENLPFEKLVDFKHPMSRTMMLMALVPGATRILERIVYDSFIGLPKDPIDLLWMIVYYAGDLLTIVVGYFVILLIINQLHLKELKSKLLYEEGSSSANAPKNK